MSSGNTAADAAEPVEPMLLTYKQAARKLGVSVSMLYLLMRDEQIRPLKLSPHVCRISQAELDSYVKRLEAEQHGDRPAA